MADIVPQDERLSSGLMVRFESGGLYLRNEVTYPPCPTTVALDYAGGSQFGCLWAPLDLAGAAQ